MIRLSAFLAPSLASSSELRRFWLRCCLLLWLPVVAAGCLTGGGRYQKTMGEGTSLYRDPVLTWVASDGAFVPYARWLPAPSMPCKGIVIAVPGLDVASVEWAQLGRYLSRKGYRVYASDLRGQGKDLTHPRRGDFHDWRRWVKDVNEFAALQSRGTGLPVAYVGLSLGSLVAMAAASSAPEGSQPQALLLQAPALVLAYPPWHARPVIAAAEVATLNQARITGPAAMQLSRTFIVSNEADQAAWERSPDRFCDGFTYRYLSTCFDVGHYVRKFPARCRIPVLIQHGAKDKTFHLSRCSPEEFYALFPSTTDKELWKHPDPNASHDMMNDRNMRSALLSKAGDWLDQHLAR